MLGTICTVAIGVALTVVTVVIGSWIRDADMAEHDVREGRFMTDTEFRMRWRWLAAGPFSFGGFSSRHFPGVACVLLHGHLDGVGRPTCCDEAVVVITDDVAQTTWDLLSGRIDGEPFGTGTAVVSLTRRMGDAEALAMRLAREYGATEVLYVHGRRVGHMAVARPVSPSTGVVSCRARRLPADEVRRRWRIVEGGASVAEALPGGEDDAHVLVRVADL